MERERKTEYLFDDTLAKAEGVCYDCSKYGQSPFGIRKREKDGSKCRMISYVRGPLVEIEEDVVVVEAGGIGYNIHVPLSVLEELPIISCIFNNNNLGMVRQWQKLFYGKRYSMTCLRSGAACRGKCGEVPCPTYTPDFMKLAESYGAKGIRVTKKEEIEPAFREAMKSKKTPYVIEFEIDPEDLVYPMIQPGGTLKDMILDC